MSLRLQSSREQHRKSGFYRASCHQSAGRNRPDSNLREFPQCQKLVAHPRSGFRTGACAR